MERFTSLVYYDPEVRVTPSTYFVPVQHFFKEARNDTSEVFKQVRSATQSILPYLHSAVVQGQFRHSWPGTNKHIPEDASRTSGTVRIIACR